MTVIINGARQVDGTPAELAIRDGALVDPAGVDDPDRSIDASGLVVLPGLVDLHTHLRQPGREDAETVASGTAAAARGGFTATFAMPNTSPVTDTAEAAEHLLTLGLPDHGAQAEVIPIGAVTKGQAGEELAELGLMARSAAGVRVFSDDGHCVADARLMRRALEYVRAFDGVIAQHAQDPRLAGPDACCHEGEISGRLGLTGWPGVAESVIVARDVQLAAHTASRVHVCHVSTAESVEIIRWAKARGVQVTAEVTPHHLLLATDEVLGYDPTYKVNPPLRPVEDIAALRDGLADGTIDIVATDHAPHARHDKEHAFADAAFGMVGLETALGVVIETMITSERIGWDRLVAAMSTLPARIGGLTGQGRTLRPGEPANLVLIDPARRRTVEAADTASLSRNNPFHGRELPDPVVATFWQGRQTYDAVGGTTDGE